MTTPYAPPFFTPSDDFYMQLALEHAWRFQALTLPNPAVGTLLLGRHGEILSIAAHKSAGAPHAEVLALQEGYARLSGDTGIFSLSSSHEIHHFLRENAGDIFRECTLFCTLEPCNHEGKTPPCAELISFLKPKRVVVGAHDKNPLASGGIERLKMARIDVTFGVLEQKCEEILLPFYSFKSGGFRFFKHAQRLNGSLSGGVISSENARTHVHMLREKIELLVISGRSARIDNPLLDSRLVSGRAPNVLVLTQNPRAFPRSLRLFGVPNRTVLVSDSLDEIMNYKFVMVEGGAGLFSALADKMDALLCYIAPKMERAKVQLECDLPFRFLHEMRVGDDILAWLARRVDSSS